MQTYDEYELLMLSKGRCEQDDYYLEPIDDNKVPRQIMRRFSRRVDDVVPLQNCCLLVFFRDGLVKKCDLNEFFEKQQCFSILKKRKDYFDQVQLQTGGHGVQWGENLSIPDSVLYQIGKRIPLSVDDFTAFASERIVNAAEAAKILNCSRQYINELVKKGQLHPVKASEKNTLFLKSEIQQRNWQ